MEMRQVKDAMIGRRAGKSRGLSQASKKPPAGQFRHHWTIGAASSFPAVFPFRQPGPGVVAAQISPWRHVTKKSRQHGLLPAEFSKWPRLSERLRDFAGEEIPDQPQSAFLSLRN
jgi:hypothetical protein